MASHDAGWDAFRDELRRWMELRGMTSRALATKLNAALQTGEGERFDEHVVKRWRHSTAPPLAAVRHIAEILGMSDDPSGQAPHDPTYILRLMRLLEPDAGQTELVASAHRLQELRLRLLDVRASLGDHSARTGSGQLVQTAISHGYAAAVYPVWEGPAGYPMHVADRIDLRPTRPDLGPVNDSPSMRIALVENFAVQGARMPRFSTSTEDLAEQEHWAIQLVGRPSTRSGQALHLDVPSIMVSSATTTAWTDDVGAMLAWLLGYGFLTTREIARELTDNPLASEELRNEVYQQFLTQGAARHVCSHHAVTLPPDNPSAPWAAPSGVTSPGMLHVRLDESDEVLDWTAPWIARSLCLDVDAAARLAKANRRDVMARLASSQFDHVRDRVVVVPVELHESAEARWEQVMRTVLIVTHRLHDLGVTANLTAIHERLVRDEPNTAPNALRWLADHGCPLVDAKFSTSPRGT